MKKVFVAILFFLGAASLSFGQGDFIKDSLDSYIIREMNIWKIPGVAVGIVKDGKVVALKGYGVREMGRTDKIDENTLFQIASNSKAFTGTAIAMLDNEKRLNLDERVRKYLPWFALKDPNATEMVTVKDILCHRIGFSTFQSDFELELQFV
ncbi:MAG: serine hydrolase domain-containing protein [Bacteroidia bacterium]